MLDTERHGIPCHVIGRKPCTGVGSGAYLGLRLPRHVLEELVEVRPVPLGVPTGFVERLQALAFLHVVHCTTKMEEDGGHTAAMLGGQGYD